MTGRKNNYIVEMLLMTLENSAATGECNILPVIQHIKDSGLLNDRKGMILRAEETWRFMTCDERNEYAQRAFLLPVDGFTLFFYEYLSLSGKDLKEIMKAFDITVIH